MYTSEDDHQMNYEDNMDSINSSGDDADDQDWVQNSLDNLIDEVQLIDTDE